MEINTKIDELSDTIDLTMNTQQGKQVLKLGLTIHYSSVEKRWWAAYGKKRAMYKVYGATAEEALRHLSEKMNTPLKT